MGSPVVRSICSNEKNRCISINRFCNNSFRTKIEGGGCEPLETEEGCAIPYYMESILGPRSPTRVNYVPRWSRSPSKTLIRSIAALGRRPAASYIHLPALADRSRTTKTSGANNLHSPGGVVASRLARLVSTSTWAGSTSSPASASPQTRNTRRPRSPPCRSHRRRHPHQRRRRAQPKP